MGSYKEGCEYVIILLATPLRVLVTLLITTHEPLSYRRQTKLGQP